MVLNLSHPQYGPDPFWQPIQTTMMRVVLWAALAFTSVSAFLPNAHLKGMFC
jgi:hypothetical protein